MSAIWHQAEVCHCSGLSFRNLITSHPQISGNFVLFYALKLRKMKRASCGLLREFFASFLTLTPHSMATERAVSHYNKVKTSGRASLQTESIYYCMHVSLNGKGTAFYDPRPAVSEILKRKQRRNTKPSAEIYKERDFVKTFLKNDNGCL